MPEVQASAGAHVHNPDGFNMKQVRKAAHPTPLTESLTQNLVDEYIAKGGKVTVGNTKRCTGADRLTRR